MKQSSYSVYAKEIEASKNSKRAEKANDVFKSPSKNKMHQTHTDGMRQETSPDKEKIMTKMDAEYEKNKELNLKAILQNQALNIESEQTSQNEDDGIDCIIKRRFQKRSIERNASMYVNHNFCLIEELRQVKNVQINNLRMKFLNEGRNKKIENDFVISYYNTPSIKKPAFLTSSRDQTKIDSSSCNKKSNFKLRSCEKIGKCQILNKKKPLTPKKTSIFHGRSQSDSLRLPNPHTQLIKQKFTPNETTNHAVDAQNRTNAFVKDKRDLRSNNINSIAANSGYSKKFLSGLFSRKNLDEFNRAKKLIDYNKPKKFKILSENMPSFQSRILGSTITNDNITLNPNVVNYSTFGSRSMSFAQNTSDVFNSISNKFDPSNRRQNSRSNFFYNTGELGVQGNTSKDHSNCDKIDENYDKNEHDSIDINSSLILQKRMSENDLKKHFAFLDRDNKMAVCKELKTVRPLNRFGILAKQEREIKKALKAKRLALLKDKMQIT